MDYKELLNKSYEKQLELLELLQSKYSDRDAITKLSEVERLTESKYLINEIRDLYNVTHRRSYVDGYERGFLEAYAIINNMERKHEINIKRFIYK